MGISIALTIGYKNFETLSKGANKVDTHLKNEDFKTNIPLLMGLLSIWNINFLHTKNEAILSYDHYLSKFKSYLQQSIMESNGKSIDRNGFPVDYQTGVTIWGETGTNGQHSFYQLLHQGTDLIPCDFILTVNSQRDMKTHHEILLRNALAQTEALMKGKSLEEVNAEISKDQKNAANYKVFTGNRPTNTILIKELNPYNLGSLIALYEHKTFVQGIIWNIFSFDQWGVELGKKLTAEKLRVLKNKTTIDGSNSSTNGILAKMLKWMN
jgi:glucose-6-phosphate isomerase